jgi:hypothetical protein
MANQPGTLEQIAIHLARAVARLPERFAGDEFATTLARLGISFPPGLLADPAVVAARNALSTAADALPAKVDALLAAVQAEDLAAIIAQGSALLNDVDDLVESFDTLPAALDAARAAFPEIGDEEFAGFAEGFARRLFDLLIVEVLDDVPGVGAALALAAILERVKPFEVTNLDLLDLEHTKIHYNRIARLFGKPAEHFSDVYDWGKPEFDGLKLLPALSELLARLGAPTAYHPPTESTSTLLEAYVLDVRPKTTIDPPGLELSIVAPFGGTIDETFTLPDPSFTGSFSARGDFRTVLTGTLRPPFTFTVQAPTADFEGRAEARLTGERDKPFVILGQAGGNRIELKTLELRGAITLSSAAGTEPLLEAALRGGRVLVDGSAGDGFVSRVLSGVKIDSAFDVAAAWTLAEGLRFEGSSSLTIMLPVHADLGPFAVREIFLVARLDGETIPVEITTSVSARLGPISASITGIGFTATISFPDDGGNAGPAQVDFAFKPPSGVGLALDVHGVRGGGFLDVDRPNHRYVGMLQLQFQNRIDVTAIGVISTQLPDGREGFSLLIIISAEFQPIQLGLGFTLNGVGGMLGLNRTVNLEVLRSGLRSSSLTSVLFPEDPIANASRIISDITAIFPPSSGRFIIGPMAKIGYGTPTFITLDLGLVIEAPDPLRLALLGVLRGLLPNEKAPLIELHVNFLGVIDFQTGDVSFDASLYDSRLLAYSLSGDVSVRARWFGLKMILLTLGGFHPSFQPPPLNLPPLRRLTLQLLDGNNPRLRLELYLAVTSNTRQIGARVELAASAGPFSVYGFLAFDVLLQFSPLYFIADVKAMLALRSGSKTIASISLALTLEGPTPWKAKGTASLKLFWFLTIKVRFSKTWGEERDAILETISLLPLVIEALSRTTSWRPELPSGRHVLVSVRKPAEVGGPPIVHPLGGLSISQQVVPLDVPIDRFGERKPADHQLFAITNVRVSGDPIAQADIEAARDHFAPAQFFDQTDAEKLSADSFVAYNAGIALGVSAELASSHYVRREVEYELGYRDSQRAAAVPRRRGLFQVDAVAFNAWARNGAVARSPLSFAATGVSALAPGAVSIAPETFAVTHIADLTLARADAQTLSEAEASALMKRLVTARPELAGRLQVVPSYEVNRSAA